MQLKLWQIKTIARVANMSENEVMALPWENQVMMFYISYVSEKLREPPVQTSRDEGEKPESR